MSISNPKENETTSSKKSEVHENLNELGAKLIKAELLGDEELVKSLKARLEAAREGENKKSSKGNQEVYEDPNEIGAKLIKAELMGDEELVQSLKARLEVARNHAENKNPNQKSSNNNQSYKSQNFNHHKKHQHNSKHDGKINDIDYEQAQMLKRNFHGDEYDNFGNGKESIDNMTKKQKNKHFQHQQMKEAKSNQSQIRKIEKEESDTKCCEFCFDNMPKHLVVSIGKHSYLSLPSFQSLVEGHCLIVPMSHQSSSVTCDEEIWNEIQDFRKALVRMYEAKKCECVFYEHYSNETKYTQHMVIECIPLQNNVSDMAPIYFKKAIVESESEWSENKKIIDLKTNGIRRSVPKNMPYFAVNFGINEGYAHIIEKSEAFPPHFAKEVIGGILDLDPLEWRRPRQDDFKTQSKKVIEFLKYWKKYDINNKN